MEQKYPLVRLRRKRKPEPRSLLVEAYLFFANRVEGWVAQTANESGRSEEDCAFVLLQALQQDFCVVEIALSEGDDSQEIFYSLNSQGRPLSQSDLLRSLIFMRAEKEKEDRDAIFDEYWGKFETAFWSAEVKRGGRTYSRLDLGLRLFLTAKTSALVDTRRVNEEYRRWISTSPPPYKSVREELSDFSRYTTVYQRYEEAPANLPSIDLRRVVSDFDVSTALPLLLFLELEAGLDAEQLQVNLAVLESFIARRIFTGEETKEYNKLFVEVIGAVKGVPSEKMQAALEGKLLAGGGLTRSWPSDEQVIEKAVTRELVTNMRTPALRLILERLELALRGRKTEDHSLPDGLQIEHVLPQNWAKHWRLDGKAIPENIAQYPFLANDEFAALSDPIRSRNSKLHTLGNLTLVNRYLNPAASNGPFDLKQAEYKHSVMRLNRYFDGLSSWDEDAIAKRGRELGELFCNIWPRPVGPSQEPSRE